MKNPSGRIFFSKYATPMTSFAVVVYGNTQLWQAQLDSLKRTRVQPTVQQHYTQQADQSV
jgi:hypothetical protein